MSDVSGDLMSGATAADHRIDGGVIEFHTQIRDRPVSCRLENGQLSGDRELMDRIRRVVGTSGWPEDVAGVARAVRQAVACQITISVADEVTADLDEPTGPAAGSGQGSIPTDATPADTTSDYWLG